MRSSHALGWCLLWVLAGCEELRSTRTQPATPAQTARGQDTQAEQGTTGEASTAGETSTAGEANTESATGTDDGAAAATTSTSPPPNDACSDTPCPQGQCCVSAGLCGKPMLVKDFGVVCLAAGDREGSLDDSCPSHSCQDPRAKCTFAGCRNQAGQCGLWLDAYQYTTGGFGDTFAVDLGCVVLDAARP